MDSLTQIVLGAAVGELCLGKKLGNRAMIWGGIAGTIPDLDIIGNLFMSEIDALAFHRGISHSIFFSVLGSLFFGWLVHKCYKGKGNSKFELPSLGSWQLMFFWGFFTHIILDTFTSYGTQLLAPFSYARIAIGSISVADPVYTVPFILCLIVAAFYNRTSGKRRKWVVGGVAISTIYLLFTLYNKSRITNLFLDNLEQDGIHYTQITVTPTILNNQLWYCIAETDSTYYQGHYSFFDKEKRVKLSHIDKNHDWIQPKEDDQTINTLKWFSNGFYNVIEKSTGGLQINDLRFGTTQVSPKPENNYIFRFGIEKDQNGYYQLTDSDGGPKKGDEKKLLKNLVERWKGV